MIELDVISASLSGIRFADIDQYTRELLSAFKISRATIEKSIAESHFFKEPVYIYQRAVFVNIKDSANKESIEVLEKKLDSIFRLLILISPERVICKDCVSDEVIEFRPEEISKYIRFFSPLIYGKAEEKDLRTTIGVAELVGTLFNKLSLDPLNANEESRIVDYVFSLIYIGFCRSAVGDSEIPKFFNWAFETKQKDFNALIQEFFEAVVFNNRRGGLSSALPHWGVFVSEKTPLPNINAPSFELAAKILCYELTNVDPEIFASLTYKLTQDDKKAGIYGHQTSFNNVAKLLNPLFVDRYEQLIDKNKDDAKALKKIEAELLGYIFFDPTNGCFLASAFNTVIELLESIKKLLGEDVSRVVNLKNFVGLMDNDISLKLSRLTLWASYLQYLIRVGQFKEADLKEVYELLNLQKGDQLDTNWSDVCPNNGNIFVIGSPVFKGSKKVTKSEKKKMSRVFRTEKLGDADYSSCWLYKLAEYIAGSTSQGAFVITNSVCQGSQVPFIWEHIYEMGCEINFAYRSFKWKNSARYTTGVSVIIVGLVEAKFQSDKKILYADNKVIETDLIGPYLINSTKVIVRKRTKPLSEVLPGMIKGDMPYDGQHLLLSREEKIKLVAKHPEATQFLRKIVGSEEFINQIERWCLWISDEELEEAQKIGPIAERIEKVRQYRLSNSDQNVHRLAERAYQFREFRSTTTHSLVIPSVSSENRAYIPIGFIGPETIVSNLAFAIYNCKPWIFGVISSRIHMSWIRTVCGALETRLRYSSRLGYNTFPFPFIDEEKQNKISSLVFDIIKKREEYCDRNLGSLYSDLPEDLRMLHEYLDVEIESCYRLEPFSSDTERVEHLFGLYQNLIK